MRSSTRTDLLTTKRQRPARHLGSADDHTLWDVQPQHGSDPPRLSYHAAQLREPLHLCRNSTITRFEGDTSAHNQSDDALDDMQEAIGDAEVLTPSSAIAMARIVRETRRAAALTSGGDRRARLVHRLGPAL